MPLIMVTGLPTSGKTTRSKQLHDFLSQKIELEQNKKYRLHYISDSTLSISRSVYDLSIVPEHARSANSSEKDARALISSAVKRVLSDNDIVILDSLNYIKGWRYQLYCEAKAQRTPSIVLQIGCMPDRAKSVNQARLDRRKEQEQDPKKPGLSLSADVDGIDNKFLVPRDDEQPYEPANWENLVFRYEEPNGMARWDSPLFSIVWDDDEAQTTKTFTQIWAAIAGEERKIVKPNQATVQRGMDGGGDYLYILEKESQWVVKMILEQQDPDGGGEVGIPRASDGEEKLVVSLPMQKLGLPQLQRMRRAFIGLNRGGIGLEMVGSMAVDRIRGNFVEYLNCHFERDT
ncbi:kti12, chromatin associated [Ceratocystis pirilliformis]|uniref:Kti12, chromatin associated n=1 Tax=Ceratocystis pirilliformis TaxID=259994 RepID=A0ABR3YNX7_9PEZI